MILISDRIIIENEPKKNSSEQIIRLAVGHWLRIDGNKTFIVSKVGIQTEIRKLCLKNGWKEMRIKYL